MAPVKNARSASAPWTTGLCAERTDRPTQTPAGPDASKCKQFLVVLSSEAITLSSDYCGLQPQGKRGLMTGESPLDVDRLRALARLHQTCLKVCYQPDDRESCQFLPGGPTWLSLLSFCEPYLLTQMQIYVAISEAFLLWTD